MFYAHAVIFSMGELRMIMSYDLHNLKYIYKMKISLSFFQTSNIDVNSLFLLTHNIILSDIRL